MKEWRPLDLVILLFATAVTVIIMYTVIDVVSRDKELNETMSEAIVVTISSIMAIIGLYVGAKISDKTKNKDN